MKRKTLHRELVYERYFKKDKLTYEHRLVLELVGENKDVLEVGCNTGYFTELLRNNGCEVVGIEIDHRAANKARQHAKKIVIGDIEDENLLYQIEKQFDVILFMHILEHLIDPWCVLERVKTLLRPDGFVIITIPNVACWYIRKELFLKGKFEYADIGILDRTHLRFFTFTTAKKLIWDSGYQIEDWYITSESTPLVYKLSKIPLLGILAPYWRSFWVTHFPNLCGAIFLFKAKIERKAE